MRCNKIAAVPNPRQAVSYSTFFLNVLTGRKPAAEARLFATEEGWASFARIRRRVPMRFRQVRVVKATFPAHRTAEVVAMVEDGATHRAMTLTFTATDHGWRLIHCDLIDPAMRRFA
ncbi:Rv3235 family protein [Glycomyces sp. NPDC046736]|uniref:Rv3235 family protein n=1 Tax=Glycomyces sp. NPDC046736 TaxID=3155615 RepID=UPI00340687C4